MFPVGLWLALDRLWAALFGSQFVRAAATSLLYETSCKIANTGWVQLAVNGVVIDDDDSERVHASGHGIQHHTAYSTIMGHSGRQSAQESEPAVLLCQTNLATLLRYATNLLPNVRCDPEEKLVQLLQK